MGQQNVQAEEVYCHRGELVACGQPIVLLVSKKDLFIRSMADVENLQIEIQAVFGKRRL